MTGNPGTVASRRSAVDEPVDLRAVRDPIAHLSIGIARYLGESPMPADTFTSADTAAGHLAATHSGRSNSALDELSVPRRDVA